jgi:Na+/melibiose symporter-like transporter
MLDAARIQWECSVMEVLPDALTVAWVLAVVAGVALLLSMRTPRLGSRLGWVYPVVMAVASVAVLVVDAAWWLTRSDPRAAAVAGVAGLWLWVAVRERIRVLERRREEFVAVGRRRVRDPRVRG